MSRFLSPRLSVLEAYTPGEQPKDMQYVKLNTNESPFPPSDLVLQMVSAAEVSKLNLYPDPECTQLKKALADTYGVKPENVFVSNGSDDILSFAFSAFCDKENGAAFPDITYGFYSVFGQYYGIDCRIVPLKEDFSIDVDGFLDNSRMVVIANPNAPTGLTLSEADIRKILNANPDQVIVVDEAYVDFGGTSMVSLIREYDNLLVVQTYSKSRSMAGARLGFCFASPAIIADLNLIKYSTNPYDINRLTQVAGTAALASDDYYRTNANVIMDNRAYFSEELRKLGFTMTDSKANFVFVKSDVIPGDELYAECKKRGVLIRHFSTPRIRDYNRITIGTREQMDTLLTVIRQILAEKGNPQ